jgi:DNA adenine methylase
VPEALKPPFTYFGGKLSIAGQIAAALPDHEHYVEPFAGSLAVLLAKSESRMETVNDLDGDLMNFWQVLRDRPADLERVCALTPHSRAEHAASNDRDGLDALERARRIWVLLTQGRGGHTHSRTGWRYYQDPRGSGSSMADYLDTDVARLAAAAARIRGVALECRPALEVVRGYGQHSGCLIYADPPYLRAVRTWTNSNGYAHEMHAESEHRELLEALLGCRASVVLSGYASPLYDDLLCTWFRREIATQASNGGTDRARAEVLWSNRPFPQGSLFDQVEDAAAS